MYIKAASLRTPIPKTTITVTNAEQVIFGGTGYDTKNRLLPEVEHSYPDYSIYPQFFRDCPTAF